MTKSYLPTDQQFLETLMRDTAIVYPKILMEHLDKRSSESVDELIAPKIVDPKDRQRYIDFNMEQLNPAKVFQGSLLDPLKPRALSYLGNKEAGYEAIPVGVLSIPEMNAFAIKTPRGGCAIALYIALWPFLKIAFYSLLAIIYRKTDNAIGAHMRNEEMRNERKE